MRSVKVYATEPEAMADLHDDPYAPTVASVVTHDGEGGGFVIRTEDNDGAERQNQARHQDGLSPLWQAD